MLSTGCSGLFLCWLEGQTPKVSGKTFEVSDRSDYKPEIQGFGVWGCTMHPWKARIVARCATLVKDLHNWGLGRAQSKSSIRSSQECKAHPQKPKHWLIRLLRWLEDQTLKVSGKTLKAPDHSGSKVLILARRPDLTYPECSKHSWNTESDRTVRGPWERSA